MASIRSLLTKYSGRIYVYLDNAEIAQRFLEDAEKEGFTFGDGVKPTERKADCIFAIYDNMTINYVGFVGHVAYQAANSIGNQQLVKINYREYLSM